MSGPDGQDHRPVANEPPGPVASEPMEISPGLELAQPRPANGPAPASGATPPVVGRPAEDEVTPEQVSLGRRLRQPRTIISIVVPLFIIGAFVGLNWQVLSKVPGLIAAANPALVLVAFLVFYAGFPLRGLRWAILLRGTGFQIRTKDSTEIIFLSWLVNCVVPAKLGDVYRAYLLKINSTASLSRTFGTVFIERCLDLIAIALLGMAAGYWSFRDGLPPAIQVVFAIGGVVVGVLAIGLFTMRNFGRRIIIALPLPHSILELYDRFEEGVFGAVRLHHLPVLALLTGAIWMTESLRLFFVVEALGFPDVELGLSGAVFVALIGSLLTAVPLSPAGLGIVEAGVVGVLTVAYGVSLPEATAIALLDRVISVFSVIVLGSIAYVVSPKPRGMGQIVQPATAATPLSTV
jgi:glycosyltransferase 2 family protein